MKMGIRMIALIQIYAVQKEGCRLFVALCGVLAAG